MVRSMYSGVSGMRSHQTRMDTIGNNIANVNTYGFKSSRTAFSDIYYQTMSSASEPNAAQGGINPSSVGYGGKVGSVDLMMGQSTFSMTDQAMDFAIDGEGFFQVQDAAGNNYYTRAGMLKFDSAGNLVDMQGNFVLGINGDPTGRDPGSERISVALPNVQPAPGTAEHSANGKEFTISAGQNSVDGNLSFNFSSGTLTDGVMAEAVISSQGIIITFNENEDFRTLDDVNNAINDAITLANGGEQHVAGPFTMEYSGDPTNDPFAAANLPDIGYLTGADLASTNYGITYGDVDFSTTDSYFGGIRPTGKVGPSFGDAFTVTPATLDNYTATYAVGPPATWNISLDVGGVTYTGSIEETANSDGKFNMIGSGPDDFIEMARPTFSDITDAWITDANGGVVATPADGADFTAAAYAAITGTASPSTPSYALGLGSASVALKGGTEGGPQTIADMTGISVAPNGIITGWDSVGTEIIIGRIDLATFANPAGLNQSGSTNFTVSANSGEPIINQPGLGGVGQLVGGTLELSNVDLSREFSDMITTQRGYQANSRIITVSDTMLEELINLKR